jgi:hypothetical protein
LYSFSDSLLYCSSSTLRDYCYRIKPHSYSPKAQNLQQYKKPFEYRSKWFCTIFTINIFL